jgi:hypothetical protein
MYVITKIHALLFIVLGAVLVTGLVAIPVMEEAEARSQTASDNNKGKQGEEASDGKRNGKIPRGGGGD